MRKKKNSKLQQLSFDLNGLDPDSLLEWLYQILRIQAVMIKKPKKKTEVQIYLDHGQSVIQIKNKLHQFAPRSFSNFRVKNIPEHNWDQRWKKGLKKIIILKKLIISPQWIHCSKSEKKPIVFIDPGMAFGTGYHPTTHMCLEWIIMNAGEWTKICDIGCGSGILAISAVKCGIKTALALDKDSDAIQAAKHNVWLNRVSKQIQVIHDTIKSIRSNLIFDCVFANLTALVIRRQWTHITHLVHPDHGMLMIAGIHQTQFDKFDGWLRRKRQWKIMDIKKDDEWTGYLLSRKAN